MRFQGRGWLCVLHSRCTALLAAVRQAALAESALLTGLPSAEVCISGNTFRIQPGRSTLTKRPMVLLRAAHLQRRSRRSSSTPTATASRRTGTTSTCCYSAPTPTLASSTRMTPPSSPFELMVRAGSVLTLDTVWAARPECFQTIPPCCSWHIQPCRRVLWQLQPLSGLGQIPAGGSLTLPGQHMTH